MTKYIVQSGSIKKYPEKMTKYFSEIFKDVHDAPNVLWCFFAIDSEDRQKRYDTYTKLFLSYFPDRTVSTSQLASVDDFEKQVDWADVIMFQGGSTELLMKELKKFDLEILLKGKVVSGSSAGAHMFARHFWSADSRVCGNGFDVLPIKVASHFYSNYGENDPRGPIDWEAAKKELEEYGDTSLPVYALEEGEFVVLKV
jgi:peptidase E